MHGEVRYLTDGKHWRRAVEAAKKLLEAYPDSDEARRVAAGMTTLEDNARIEEVRGLRDQIRDMLERRRYGEAVEIAEGVMERFPETQAAAELRKQIRRLRRLAEASS